MLISAWRGAYPVFMASLDTISTDYRTITEACGLLDRSERGKLALTGSDARSFLQGQVTNDVESLAAGGGCYAAFLTPKGKMLGDLRILATDDELLLDTERVALQGLFNMIRRFSIGYDVEMHKRTLERGLLSLVGPGAAVFSGAGDLPDEEHAHALVSVPGSDLVARAVRTDVGIDLLCDAGDVEALRAALEEAGVPAVAEAAVECLRVERGRPRYGIDLDDSVIPQEAGLNERAVSFTKGCYVGQETVARLYYRGKPNRLLRGLRLSAPASAGDQLTFEGRTVGQVASVAQSPAFGPIALALVRREAPQGTVVTVGDGAGATAEVVELPFGTAFSWISGSILSSATLNNFMTTYGYASVFVLMLLESASLPVPSEVVLPLASYFVRAGTLSFWPVVVVSTVASLAGALLDYYLAKWLGRPFVMGLLRLFRLHRNSLDRAEAWFDLSAQWTVFAARFVPGLRTVISFPAGLFEMKITRYVLMTVVGCLAWSAILVYAGFLAGSVSASTFSTSSTVIDGLSALAAAMSAAYILYYGFSGRKAMSGEPSPSSGY